MSALESVLEELGILDIVRDECAKRGVPLAEFVRSRLMEVIHPDSAELFTTEQNDMVSFERVLNDPKYYTQVQRGVCSLT